MNLKNKMNKHTIIWILSIIIILVGIVCFQSAPLLVQETQHIAVREHPRLLFNAEDINTLRERANTTHAEIWSPIKSYVLSNLNELLPETAPDEGLTSYRNYANRLIPNAFVSILLDQDEIKSFTKNYMLTLSKWQQWGENNYRDLGLAHMLLANSLAYDWLYSQLTENERTEVRTSLGNWAEKMYEASFGTMEIDWSNWWRKSYMQNHHWINNSALGIAGLALLGEDDRAQKWINQASTELSKVKYLLEGIGDGSWHESVNYQNYGLTLSLPFLKCLKTSQQIDLLSPTYLKNYVTWRIYNYLPNTTQSIFSHGNFEQDWGSGYAPQNILRFIAAEYNNQKAEWMAQKLIQIDGRYNNQWRAPWYVFEFLYYKPEITPEPPNDTILSAVFPDFSGIIWRTGWNDDALVFGIKSGAYGGRFAFESFVNETYPWDVPCEQNGCQLNIGHNHDDTNCFYISKAGKWLAPESEGVGKTATSLHNTLLIDGRGQYRPEKYWNDPEDFSDCDGSIQKYVNSINYNYISADATRRYKQIIGLNKVNRQILFIRPDYFVIVDNIKALQRSKLFDKIYVFNINITKEEIV